MTNIVSSLLDVNLLCPQIGVITTMTGMIRLNHGRTYPENKTDAVITGSAAWVQTFRWQHRMSAKIPAILWWQLSKNYLRQSQVVNPCTKIPEVKL